MLLVSGLLNSARASCRQRCLVKESDSFAMRQITCQKWFASATKDYNALSSEAVHDYILAHISLTWLDTEFQ